MGGGEMLRRQSLLSLVATALAAAPAGPMYDPMAVGLVYSGNEEANVGKNNPSTLKAGKAPDVKDMLAGYSYAEINFLDGWAKFILFQYSLQAYRMWITGETMHSAKDLRDYWFSTSMFVYKKKDGGDGGSKANLERGGGDEGPALERSSTTSLAEAVDALQDAPRADDGAEPAMLELGPVISKPSAAARPLAASSQRASARPPPRMEREPKAAAADKKADVAVAGGVKKPVDPMDTLQALATGQYGSNEEAKARRRESLSKLSEWLRLMGFQNQLWGSCMLVGAVRNSQIALMIEFELVGGGTTVAHDFVSAGKAVGGGVADTQVLAADARNGWDNLTPWRRYWLARRMQLEWLTNSAVEAWQGYQIPEAQLQLGQTLIALNPSMKNWVQQITLADTSQMTNAHAIIKRYSLRAEWYAWECWKKQNGAEFMLAMAVYEEIVMTKETTAGQHVFTKLESAKIYLPGLTQRFIQLGQNWVAARILLETPLNVVAAVFMWSPKPQEGAPTTPSLERAATDGGEGGELERRRAAAEDEARAKRFLASTKNAIPWIAMQFAQAVLYRNYVARTLLNAQLKSTLLAKFRVEMLLAQQRQQQLHELRRAQPAAANQTVAPPSLEMLGGVPQGPLPPMASGLAMPRFEPPPLAAAAGGPPFKPLPWLSRQQQRRAQVRQLFSQQPAQRLPSDRGATAGPQPSLRPQTVQPPPEQLQPPQQPPLAQTLASLAQATAAQPAAAQPTAAQPAAAQPAAAQPAAAQAPAAKAVSRKEQQQLAEAELTEQERRELSDFLRRKAGEQR